MAIALLEAMNRIDGRDAAIKRGASAILYWAVALPTTFRAVEFLMKEGADPDFANAPQRNGTAYSRALFHGMEENAKAILRRATPTKPQGQRRSLQHHEDLASMHERLFRECRGDIARAAGGQVRTRLPAKRSAL